MMKRLWLCAIFLVACAAPMNKGKSQPAKPLSGTPSYHAGFAAFDIPSGTVFDMHLFDFEPTPITRTGDITRENVDLYAPDWEAIERWAWMRNTLQCFRVEKRAGDRLSILDLTLCQSPVRSKRKPRSSDVPLDE